MIPESAADLMSWEGSVGEAAARIQDGYYCQYHNLRSDPAL